MNQGNNLLNGTVILTAASVANRGIGPLGAACTAGGRCIGPAKMTLPIGAACPYVQHGTEAWESGGAFALHDKLQVDASGRVVLFSAGVFVGVAQEAATAAGQFPEVLVVPN